MNGVKFCRKCAEELILDKNWTVTIKCQEGNICRSCFSVIDKARYYKNREKRLPQMRKYQQNRDKTEKNKTEKNKPSLQERLDVGLKKKSDRYKLYAEGHTEQIYIKRSRRRAYEKSAFCVDADINAIKQLYLTAKKLENITGVRYHIDHLIPLSKGGRHHQDNLVIMRADYNLNKADKIIPELIHIFGGEFEKNQLIELQKKAAPQGGFNFVLN